MTEKQIEEILNSTKYTDAIKKISQIYPKGFDINKIDKRVKNKLEELTNKYMDIQKPIQLRKNS